MDKLILRPYQADAVRAVYDFLRARTDNPCVVIPTAGGKTQIIAQICSDAVTQWGGRVLILAHVKELLQQAADKLARVCPDVDVGIYSAGLGSRDKTQPVIVAGIQSVSDKACELGKFDLILVDEAHLIPADGEGRYRQFLTDSLVVNPAVRVVGFTATPFRCSTGSICTPEGFLNDVCYEVGVRQLIVEGYLCPLINKTSRTKFDTDGLHVRGGEFIASEVETLMDDDPLVEAAVSEIIEDTKDRKSILIFAAGIDHGLHVGNVLESRGQDVGFVSGSMGGPGRDRVLQRFRDGEVKYLVNVNVLTTGYDEPRIDCVVLLRPTMSPGLYYQMVGRGFRLFDGKANCLIRDFAGNIKRHGPVDLVTVPNGRGKRQGGDAPTKECEQCLAVVAAGYSLCPFCGFAFPPPDRQKHDATASSDGVLSGDVTDTVYEVIETRYNVHTKKDKPDGPRTMRVDYFYTPYRSKSEWICVEHDGWTRDKAVKWWRQRSHDPCPVTAEAAVEAANAGALCSTLAIKYREISGERFGNIVDWELGELPAALEPLEMRTALATEEVPF